MLLIGYKKDPMNKNHYLIDDEAAPVVKEIFQLARDGLTPTAISKIMTEKKYKVPSDVVGNTHTRTSDEIKRGWNRNAVKRILTNPVYLGNVVNGKLRKINYKSKKILNMPKEDWIIVENQHEPLVDKETFDIVQLLIKSRTRTRKQRHEWILSGMLVCEECGKKLSIFNPNKKDVFYTKCNTYSSNTALHLCTPHTNKVNVITEAILNNIKDTCKMFLKNEVEHYSKLSKETYKKYESNLDIIKKEITTLEHKILNIEKKINCLYEDKINEKIKPDDFERIYRITINEKENILNRIESLKESSQKENVTFDFNKLVSDFVSMKSITRTLLVQLVDKITVDKEKNVKIYYKFNVLNNFSDKKEIDVIKINHSKKKLKIS